MHDALVVDAAGPLPGWADFARRLQRGPGAHLRAPGGRGYAFPLVVADVDLDTGNSAVVHRPGPDAGRAVGVHALVWLHGEPVGALVLHGDPQRLLPMLAERAAATVAREVSEHHLRDALAVRGGVQRLAADPGAAPDHPRGASLPASEVTVAVCTRDRPEQLRDCLAAVVALADPVAQVLVVDNASRDDATRRVAAEFGARCVREPRRGLDWARNRALLEARTPVVAFTDDDVLVHPGWVRGLCRAFGEEPDAVAVTGLVVPAELDTLSQVVFEAQGGFGRGYQRRWFSAAVAAGEPAGLHHAGIGQAGTGADMALRREAVLALGGFDTALDVGTPTGGGGDLEMLFRIVAAGHLVVYEPSAVVRHRHRADLPGLSRQRRGDGSGSYSWWLGAGARYGAAERRVLRRRAVAWAWEHHAKRAATSLLWPQASPRALARADAAGVVAATWGRSYERARAQAAAEAAAHPQEPPAPPLHHPDAARARRPVDAVHLDVDLWRDDLAGDGLAGGGEPARRTIVDARVDGEPVGVLTVDAAGSRTSRARLRWELAASAAGDVMAAAEGRAAPQRGAPRVTAADAVEPVWVLPSAGVQRARRGLRPPVSTRMCRPGQAGLFGALAVADVDLDAGTAQLLEPVTRSDVPVEGVHAVAWLHGEPVGELTVPGVPELLLPGLAAAAAKALAPAVREHLERDALATGRPAAAAEPADDLGSVEHPAATGDPRAVTVAVCTRDRPDDLALCLEAIGRLAAPVGEVLVVDNAPVDDATRRVVERFAFARYVREPRRGLDWARNRALQQARTPVVAFTDDDVLVHPTWVDGLVRAFAEEPQALAVTGLVLPAELATPAQVAFEATSGFGRGYRRRWLAVDVAGGEPASRAAALAGGMGTGANMAFRREELLALGGFDTALDVGTPTGGGGDLEALFRIAAAGRSVVYEPSAVVLHRHRRTMAELERQRRGDGTGHVSLLLGAAPRYPARERWRLRGQVVLWVAGDNARAVVGSLFWPRVRQPRHALAKVRGSWDALVGALYAKAVAQALTESAAHPADPPAPVLPCRLPPPSAPRAVDGQGARAARVVDVELSAGGLGGGGLLTEGRTAAVTAVHAQEAGAELGVLRVATAGAPLSRARVRWELAAALAAPRAGTVA